MKPKTNRFAEDVTAVPDEAPHGLPAIDVHEGAILEDGMVVRVRLFGADVDVDPVRQTVTWRQVRWRVVQLEGRYCLVSN